MIGLLESFFSLWPASVVPMAVSRLRVSVASAALPSCHCTQLWHWGPVTKRRTIKESVLKTSTSHYKSSLNHCESNSETFKRKGWCNFLLRQNGKLNFRNEKGNFRQHGGLSILSRVCPTVHRLWAPHGRTWLPICRHPSLRMQLLHKWSSSHFFYQ